MFNVVSCDYFGITKKMDERCRESWSEEVLWSEMKRERPTITSCRNNAATSPGNGNFVGGHGRGV